MSLDYIKDLINKSSLPDKESKKEILEKILKERERQIEIPGSEWDMKKTPNDWVAVATHYLSQDVKRSSTTPTQEEFEDSLIKACAVIIAGLEHVDIMKQNKYLN